MIYLDTHVVVWLYAGETLLFTQNVHEMINHNDLYVSPIVRLELQYLYEINRITEKPDTIISDLSGRVGLRVDTKPFDQIITAAVAMSWTRDPFDRIIVAQASLNNHFLVSKDKTILVNYPLARWF